jgi:hypothetical protein
MKRIQREIARRQSEFANHEFFGRFEDERTFPEGMAFAPTLTFWVMAFQDILRMNEDQMTDPKMRKIARHHRAEDAGHQLWFLADLATLGNASIDVPDVFGEEHEATRRAAYALVSEVFRATDDRLRVVLLLTLESAGHIFFERVASYADTHGFDDKLQYFSSSHLEVEQNHKVFEDKMNAEIEAMEFPPEIWAEAMKLTDRVYGAFNTMFNALVETDRRTNRIVSDVVPSMANTAPVKRRARKAS